MELLTLEETARLLRVSRNTVRRACLEGRLHPIRVTRRGRPMFWATEIVQLVESQLREDERRGTRNA